MKSTHVRTLAVSVVCLLALGSVCIAQPSQGRGRGLYGDWEVKMTFGERTMTSILSFGRDEERNLTGQWISFWGVTDLQDVTFEEGKLHFVQVVRFGDQEMKSTFNGTVNLEEGTLSGMLVSDRGELPLEGKRVRRMPSVAGTWDLTLKMGEREFNSTLVVSVDKEGQLQGEWKSRWGESKVTEIQYERRTLTLTRVSTFNDQQWESTLEATVGRDGLEGTIKSERGEIAVTGTRVGDELIGRWDLTVASERGERKQQLVVYPDLSARYGAMPIKQVTFEDGKVGFDLVLEFGENDVEMKFTGRIEDGKLVGEMTTARGTSKITGTKRTFMRRSRPQD